MKQITLAGCRSAIRKENFAGHPFPQTCGAIWGNEAHGIISMETQRIADLTVKIWKFGQAESLNVGTADRYFAPHRRGDF